MLTKSQRLILISSVVHFVIAVSCFYMLNLWPLGLVLMAGNNFLLFRQSITTKKPIHILSRVVRPTLWLLLTQLYLQVAAVLASSRLLVYIVSTILAIIWHAIICQHELAGERNETMEGVFSLALIFLSASVTSLLLAYYNWPLFIVLILTWLINLLIALWWFARMAKNVNFLAAVWALVATEIIWISARWQIFYQVPKIRLFFSQTAILLAALAYCWGGIYANYKDHKLTRKLVFEYIFVSALVCMILIVFTH